MVLATAAAAHLCPSFLLDSSRFFFVLAIFGGCQVMDVEDEENDWRVPTRRHDDDDNDDDDHDFVEGAAKVNDETVDVKRTRGRRGCSRRQGAASGRRKDEGKGAKEGGRGDTVDLAGEEGGGDEGRNDTGGGGGSVAAADAAAAPRSRTATTEKTIMTDDQLLSAVE